MTLSRPIVALVAVALTTAVAAVEPSWLESGRSIALAEYRWMNDVRWLGDDELLLAAGPVGLLRLNLGGESPQLRSWPAESVGFSARLGVSDSSVASAAPFHSIVGVDLDTAVVQELSLAVQLDFIADVDRSGDRLLVLGSSRGTDGSFSPDGAMAWLGRIDEPGSLRPVLYSRGPIHHTMGDCGIFDVGACRFLPDGGFALLPGVERGLLWYAADGSLTAELSASDLGIDTDCEIPPESRELYLRSDVMRHTLWLSKRRTVDDLLSLPGGLGVFVRRFEDGATIWDLIVVQPGEIVERRKSVLRVASPFAHLRADWRDGRLAVLVIERGPDEPVSNPRLLVVELPS